MTQISNNERPGARVSSSSPAPEVALTIFNRSLGANACTSSVWAGYLCELDTPHYIELDAQLLSHVETKSAAIAS
ncbi:MAG: hypothetical protein IV107_20580 [Paucibacter sp.]|nr:hypothetical protein [Roseateles sp.]